MSEEAPKTPKARKPKAAAPEAAAPAAAPAPDVTAAAAAAPEARRSPLPVRAASLCSEGPASALSPDRQLTSPLPRLSIRRLSLGEGGTEGASGYPLSSLVRGQLVEQNLALEQLAGSALQRYVERGVRALLAPQPQRPPMFLHPLTIALYLQVYPGVRGGGACLRQCFRAVP
jgi:hypothetical protein